MSKRIVIVGGVAGGASAAARLRRLNEQDEIILVERGEHVSFANCGLPYYIGETIDSREKLFLQTPKGIQQRFNIDVRTLTEVTAIDRESKQVFSRNVITGEVVQIPYDILILSPGARPVVPQIPGITSADNLFTLRNIPDTDRIKAYVDHQHPKHATVIGAGFIGLEMAENLRERGLEVTVIDRGTQILNPLDPEMARPVEEHMRLNGVELRLNEGVEAIIEGGRLLQLASGTTFATDMIILAIGVTPENELARNSGLELGVRGAVKVTATLQTSDPAIYAVGDVIEVRDKVQGFETMVSLAWGANRQGRLAADHINGRSIAYEGALGTAIIKTFGLTSALTGNNEKTLKSLGVPYEAIHIHPNSHAGYYPGAAPIAIKLLFSPQTGEIFGAQAVGSEGADKRIDVIATAIRGKLRADELADIELAYAPPYSSAKDPVNMAGYVASNVMEGMVKNLQWYQVDDFTRSGGLIIDVRDEVERLAGYIPGSINIPLSELRNRLTEIPSDQKLAVSCQVGLRGYIAARMLMQYGYDVQNVDGGYKTYAVMAIDRGVDPEGEKKNRINVPEVSSPTEQRLMLDACGLQCPGPILKVYETVKSMEEGQQLEIVATDFGFAADIRQWCLKTQNTLESLDVSGGKVQALVRKGIQKPVEADAAPLTSTAEKEGTSMVIFSGDLDKAIASFIIASGAAAMGKQVTMFFTFWGLNLLRREQAPEVHKKGLDKMFGMMMPQGTRKLSLSKMNMGGLGAKLIRHTMKRKNVDSLEQLMSGAIHAGVKLMACTMSMDIMGIKQEELIAGVEFGGVASYLGAAEDSGVNLFI
ncbi:pyridine nucleotide-disulfide oxidoreductase [Paenibacillus helianthi]|uniref:Pyridine nucleotide-disulfide oxidoreductase n=1 Tax=Paenibacillus helianthi TaxID=1349432 RepID=A0ABX3EHK8_9BACL|nr:CoA-disulfide reductase [Paenibacillus helianthi]OKP80681.1 pyridine nucleotide-disulfide oxidoreductase [Paenibacillus helianthi]